MAGRRLPDVTDDGRPVLSQGPVTGSLNASSPPVSGSYIYNWRVALASAPTTYVKQQQTTAASNTFEGLTPGQTYNVELNAVGTAGTTDWSGPGELMTHLGASRTGGSSPKLKLLLSKRGASF